MSKEYLKRIVRDVLAESDIKDDVIDAIKKRYEVTINYQPENEGGRGKRVIQPIAYGTTKSGNLAVRAYQPYGDTSTKIPRWKLFRLDRIKSWKGHKRKRFTEPPSDFGKFNPNGDSSMENVFLVANFDTSRYDNSGLKRYNDARRAAAVEKDPLHNFRRNVRNSQKLGDVDYIKRNLELWKNSQAAKDFHANNNNVKSVDAMERTGNVDDGNQVTMNGPVKKGGYADDTKIVGPENHNDNVDYSEIEKIGPVNKEENYDEYEQR